MNSFDVRMEKVRECEFVFKFETRKDIEDRLEEEADSLIDRLSDEINFDEYCSVREIFKESDGEWHVMYFSYERGCDVEIFALKVTMLDSLSFKVNYAVWTTDVREAFVNATGLDD